MAQPKLSTPASGHGGRGYRIPGRVDANGKQAVWPGITTVLNQIAKPQITQWACDQTAAYAVANIPQLQERSEEIGWGYLRFYWNREPDENDPLRMFHAGVLNDAAELGTNLHEFIEADVGHGSYPKPSSERSQQMIDAWEEWLLTHDVISHHAEFTLVDDVNQVAGTADHDWTVTCLHDEPCLGDNEPHRCLIDVKTARSTWPEHRIQVSFLHQCPTMMVEVTSDFPGAMKHEATRDGKKVVDWWTEKPAPEFERVALLHIRPDDLDSRGEAIPAFCKLIEVTDLDIYFQGFLGANALARMGRAIKDREKSRQRTEK